MKIKLSAAVCHIILICAALIMIFPIIYAVSNSFKTLSDAYNSVFQLIPSHPTVENYLHVMDKLPIVRITANTFLIAASVTLFKTATGLLAAYSFVYFEYNVHTIYGNHDT